VRSEAEMPKLAGRREARLEPPPRIDVSLTATSCEVRTKSRACGRRKPWILEPASLPLVLFRKTAHSMSKAPDAGPVSRNEPNPGTDGSQLHRVRRSLSALERLQGKKPLHGLAPEAGLVPTEPVDELIVEVRQTQLRAMSREWLPAAPRQSSAADSSASPPAGTSWRDSGAISPNGLEVASPGVFDRPLPGAPEGVENLGLHLQQPGFDRGRAAKSPEQDARRCTSSRSTGVCGRYSATMVSSKTRYSPGSSRGSTTVSAVSPCLSRCGGIAVFRLRSAGRCSREHSGGLLRAA
jgi:hypothetical protein